MSGPKTEPEVGKGTRAKTAGSGRAVGTPNKATVNAREAIARLVDSNAERMQEWLDAIAESEGPMAAWRCLSDVIEYHVPKLSRSELTGANGGAIKVETDQKAIQAEIREMVTRNPALKELFRD